MFKHEGLANLLEGLANRLKEDGSQTQQPKGTSPRDYPDEESFIYPVRFELDDMSQEEIDECIRANNGIGRFRIAPRRAHKMF